jgi:hypothetical protein|tara:strand:- start:303 stop:500 length:198 start_codon:yes stop_codon:yes gene_type:complete
MVRCRRVTVKKHGTRSFTVNLGGKAMYEVGTKEHGKRIARALKVTEARKCGKKVSKKEANFADNF